MDTFEVGVQLLMSSNHAGILRSMYADLETADNRIERLQERIIKHDQMVADRLSKGFGTGPAAAGARMLFLTNARKETEALDKKLEEAESRFGATQMIFAGGLAIGGLAAVMTALDNIIEKSGKVNTEINKMLIAGMPMHDVKDLETVAKRVAFDVPGTRVANTLEDARALRASLGELEVGDPLAAIKEIMPDVERASLAVQFATGREANEQHFGESGDIMKILLKAVDLRGVVDPKTHEISPSKFKDELNEIVKTLEMGGGLIKPNDLYLLMQQAGPMGKGLPAAEYYDMMATAVMEMNGPRAGTALTALGRQLIGGRMAKHFAEGLAAFGMIPEHSARPIGMTGYVELNDAARAQLEKELDVKGGVFGFAQQLKTNMEAKGLTDPKAQNEVLYRLFSTETGRRLMSIYISQAQVVLRDKKLREAALSPDEAYNSLSEFSLAFSNTQRAAAWDNAWSEIGESGTGLKQWYNRVMGRTGRGLARTFQSINENTYTDQVDQALHLGSGGETGGIGIGEGVRSFGRRLLGLPGDPMHVRVDNQQPTDIHVDIHIDDHHVARTIMRGFVRDLDKPFTAGTDYDPRALPFSNPGR